MTLFVTFSVTEFFRDANVLDCCWWVEKLEILKSVWKMQNKLSRTAQCRITRLDKYEMLETVGEGAYGIVWKARNRGKDLAHVKWSASSRGSPSLCCHMRKSDQRTIGKTHPTLLLPTVKCSIYKFYFTIISYFFRNWRNCRY